MRTEKDSLGELNVPDDVLYGVHTCRSIENFHMSGEKMPLELIYAMVQLKQACAAANAQLGLLPHGKAVAIAGACGDVLSGKYDDQFPIDIFQAGSGTSSNMNVNEVLANLAAEALDGTRGDRSLVHPNDDVNMGQSTNNVFPSAIRIAAVQLSGELSRALKNLILALEEKGQTFSNVWKSGRTHLQDAVPVTLGQEFTAWAQALRKAKRRIACARMDLHELGIGGNAIGTGVNTPAAFRGEIIKALNQATGQEYRIAENGIEITQFLSDLGAFSGALKMLALDLNQIVNNLRLLSSGPNTGLGEVNLPPVEPGSSIMPGKINPSICEAANMGCLQVIGNDAAVAAGCAAGQLELNTHMPLVGANLVKSLKILTEVCAALDEKCVHGITANEAVCKNYFERSAGLPTILNPILGYDRVALLVKESLSTGKPLTELVREKKLMPEDEFKSLLTRSNGPSL
ncbi:MAG: aspartate ammonia-lyase [Verrucomicrobiota bacterium]|jgi:aspartate ammonia-lyase|nr:aspartate ammonia-lyase [Verrucomicrobiota bacterium]MDK2964169.1 aspartate ammonia-lyase [Verrucomicrobiota bacterium]